MKRMLVCCAFVLLLFPAVSRAALINIETPVGSYIPNFMGSGLDVAWAAPCAPLQPSCGVIDLSFQSAFGWRLVTPAEATFLGGNLDATDFVFPGANVPFGGSDVNGAFFAQSPGGVAACAAPYFSTAHFHCDFINGVGSSQAVPWGFGLGGDEAHAEAIVVRGAQIPQAPEPATFALFGVGALMVWMRRSRQQR